jgi:hypothetical protein
VTLDMAVLVHDIRRPLRWDESERSIRRQRPTLFSVHPPQYFNRLQHRIAFDIGLESKRIKQRGRELP